MRDCILHRALGHDARLDSPPVLVRVQALNGRNLLGRRLARSIVVRLGARLLLLLLVHGGSAVATTLLVLLGLRRRLLVVLLIVVVVIVVLLLLLGRLLRLQGNTTFSKSA